MSTEQAPQAAEYRGDLHLTLPLPILRRLEPYKAQRRRTAFIEDAIMAALDQAEQDRERAAAG